MIATLIALPLAAKLAIYAWFGFCYVLATVEDKTGIGIAVFLFFTWPLFFALGLTCKLFTILR